MVTVDFRTRSELKALAAALLLLAVVLSLYVAMAPAGPTEGTASADRLRPGPHAVGRVELELSDGTRPTRANGSFPGAPSRDAPGDALVPGAARTVHTRSSSTATASCRRAAKPSATRSISRATASW